MGPDASSPLPMRLSSHIPASPAFRKPGAYREGPSDLDELTSDDLIPCSPYSHTTQPTQIVNRTASALTQPTQIVNRAAPTQPTQIIHRSALSSFPRESSTVRSPSPLHNIIEVPASSPPDFSSPQRSPTPKTAGGRIASRLAPAGTFFRQPLKAKPPPTMNSKSPLTALVISDDEDELSASRGDIRPTSFKRQISSFAYVPKEENSDMLVSRVKTMLGRSDVSTEACRAALKMCNNSPAAAVDLILRSKAASSSVLSVSSSPLSPAKPLRPTTPPRRRGRLVRGLRPRNSPASSQDVEVIAAPQPSPKKAVIEILDSEDDYQDLQLSQSDDETVDGKTLRFINDSTIEDLAAMTGVKIDDLNLIIEKRPFDSLTKVKRVSTSRKKSAKAARISIGETVVDRIEEFTRAVNAIDEIVAICESKATELKDIMGIWDLDFAGKTRSQQANMTTYQDNEQPMSPLSLESTKLVDPPISHQPTMMNGHCTMRPFQIFGLNWMNLLYGRQYGGILADEMGLGKTCQVISLMCQIVESHQKHTDDEEKPWPNLIVVPPSTYSNWLGEFERFAPGLCVIGYQGSQSERRQIAADILDDPDSYHVILSTYTQLVTDEDTEAMIALRPHTAIFDEGHKMKNPQTRVYKQLIRIPSQWRMLLTGTPVQNNIMEMIALLQFIEPKMFRRHIDDINYLFNQKVSLRDVASGALLYSERVTRARTILEPFILQRRKQQVLSDMPSKICNIAYCDLAKSQRPIYENHERLFKMEPKNRGRNGGRSNDNNNPWIQLRKAAIHPQLFRRHFDDQKVEKMAKILMDSVPQSELMQPNMVHLVNELKNNSDFELHLWCRDYACIKNFDVPAESWLESGKVDKLLELCETYRRNGDRVLVFSKFVKVLDILSEVLATKGIEYRMLSGSTDVAERQDLIDQYNSDPEILVFLLTTGAGGTGINLTSANKVIIFDQSDNPQDDIQAENRAHRLGQTRDVEVIRLISHNTVEELIYKACQKKIELAEKVTGGVADISDAKDTKDDEMTLEREVRRMMEERMSPL